MMRAVLLAGGNSERMGTDKSLLIIEKITLIELITMQLLDTFDEIVIITNNRLRTEIENIFNNYAQVRVVEDLIPDKGPMGGLFTAYNVIDDEVFFMTSCDNVAINSQILDVLSKFIGNYDIVAPMINNRYEPMFAFYSRSSFSKVEANVKSERLSMQKLLAEVNTKAVKPESIGVSLHEEFGNMNTEKEFESMLPMLRDIEHKYTK
ncbi:MAG: molybdenum cofactor guanylyltransferase [Planctomycetes bacterium]|nr:molybdenum cofactor guanylyltransferase [Planctomycetota bacterium]